MNQLRTIKQRIEYILNDSEQSRNYDKVLYLSYIQKFHPSCIEWSNKREDFYISFKGYMILPNYATIKRLRAIIQKKEGKFLPTDAKIIRLRRMQQKQMKSFVKEQSLNSQHP